MKTEILAVILTEIVLVIAMLVSIVFGVIFIKQFNIVLTTLGIAMIVSSLNIGKFLKSLHQRFLKYKSGLITIDELCNRKQNNEE